MTVVCFPGQTATYAWKYRAVSAAKGAETDTGITTLEFSSDLGSQSEPIVLTLFMTGSDGNPVGQCSQTIALEDGVEGFYAIKQDENINTYINRFVNNKLKFTMFNEGKLLQPSETTNHQFNLYDTTDAGTNIYANFEGQGLVSFDAATTEVTIGAQVLSSDIIYVFEMTADLASDPTKQVKAYESFFLSSSIYAATVSAGEAGVTSTFQYAA